MKLFAQTCQLLDKESSIIKKVELISQSLRKIQSNEELYLFCVYLTGSIYPAHVQNSINVGKAILKKAILELTAIPADEWESLYREKGEVGEAIEYILSPMVIKNQHKDKNQVNLVLIDDNNTISYDPEPNFSLVDLSKYIDLISRTTGNIAKTRILTKLFSKLEPLEAKFAAKILLQNLRIGVQEATVEQGIAQAFDVKKEKVSQINFYLGDIGEVAVRCKHKNFEKISFRLFHPVKAMLASAETDVKEIFKRIKNYVWVEYKYDGIRSHIHKQGERVEIYTRDLKRITDQFPEIVEFFKKVRPDNQEISFLLDGEIVPYKNGTIRPFAYIQKRLGKKDVPKQEIIENPTSFIAYDILFLNGELLIDKKLEFRRQLLERTFGGTDIIFATQKVVKNTEEFLQFFTQSRNEGREGVMIKDPNSRYQPGKRGIHWLKYKQTLDPLDVVVLYAEFGEGKNARYLSSFTFGVWNDDKSDFEAIGKVSSGFTEDELQALTDFIPTIAIEKLPNGYKVHPEIIFEVAFENVQVSDRYPSGYAVRFPRFIRNRTQDKPIDEISSIKDVRNIYSKIKGKTTK